MSESIAARVWLSFAAAIAMTALDAVALLLVWWWHVVPVFGAPVLTFSRAFAIVVMVRLALKHGAGAAPRSLADAWRLALGRAISDVATVSLAYLAWVLS